ncbi:bile acid:sodium symporter family protein [Aliiglaciecola sp. LCG003]|uniref:bile acid:sodium symporter family protein n=1 Tax=Aliiglaciecola sp. LCG003 TaxID=3053655 RepID=UPI00257238BC|nr:bile acid:sodium symporter family protein [Aliiglaciecola sp. LCG003]WJG10281.1 bile acid:sodium symporter family protein [Aliiglaciecola sp. LCG003]
MSALTLFVLNAVLAMMMFGIALSLTTADFKRIVSKPKGPMVGLAAQFILLPALTCGLTWLIPMPSEVALGLILVSCCPGGSFSNLMTYLSNGNTAMSVSMTGVASLLACVLTPFNFMLYAELNPHTQQLMQTISVSATDMLVIVALVLALPLAAGLFCANHFPHFARRSEPFFRIVSLITLFGFVAIALTMNWQRFIGGASIFLLAVVFHNALALMIGWGSARALGLNKADRRAITLEVGLQNSGLGLGIIFTFFADQTAMAIIAAAWGIWHLISGMGLSLTWQYLDRRHARQNKHKKQFIYES